MRAYFKLPLLIGCIFFSSSVLAQPQITSEISALEKLFDAVSNLFSKSESVALRSDKDKFKKIGIEMYSSLYSIITDKQILLEKIKSNNWKDYKESIKRFSKSIEELKDILEKSNALTKEIGVDAIDISSNLRSDILKKESMLDQIEFADAHTKTKVIVNLNEGISLLTKSKDKLERFIKVL
jgi:hypothetical protein